MLAMERPAILVGALLLGLPAVLPAAVGEVGHREGSQRQEVEIDSARVDGGKLVLTTGDGEETSPDGTFLHDSGDYSIEFDHGNPVAYDGVDGESEPIPIERLVVRDNRISIDLDRDSKVFPKVEIRPRLEDGSWVNGRSGASFEVVDGRIVKCKGPNKP